MKTRPRIRKTVKWGGAVAGLLLIALWAASGWWAFEYWFFWGNRIVVADGVIRIYWPTNLMSANQYLGWHFGWMQGPAVGVVSRFRPWFFFESLHTSGGFGDGALGSEPQVYHGWLLDIPVWAVAGAVAIPTVIAWRRDFFAARRARPGLCTACGYLRQGLPSSLPCPECGATAPSFS